ncbi:hypothetical protein H6G06_20065 [Anabaena sphaerica FACHB-251]|uniref:Alpha/beta hydrolase n=1 Tax=Anabaena sphaerica FACHB-251 TaxID=2692883 RepID=A0A926WJS4_9NOST|nr:hypothetical protein [Anabaena sphaerica]MBD2295707.1 hypothetical protein [Anabaena sphaerica FACHB-251]
MTTVIFIHGTGVREAEYNKTLKLIEQKLLSQRPDLTVLPCLWGDSLGIKFNAQGASIPLYDATLALGDEEEDPEIILWQQLYRDPLYELRVLSLKSVEGSNNPFGEQPSDRIQLILINYQPTPELNALLTKAGITEEFTPALAKVTQSEPYNLALSTAADSVYEWCLVISRAIIAQAIFDSQEKEQYPLILTDADLRDKLVESLTLTLTEPELGLGNWTLQKISQLLQPIGTNWVKRRRGAITNSVSPMPGDILLYQARGEKIRAFIRETIANAEPPVVLICHSLGGIAAVDLLIQEQLPAVELLVTVGSQAPFLYEINALSSLEFGQPLPAYFPQWLNIYDLRDFLSYIGANIFPNQVQDVQVDSKQPFPQAHGAYWTNTATWKAIIPRLP